MTDSKSWLTHVSSGYDIDFRRPAKRKRRLFGRRLQVRSGPPAALRRGILLKSPVALFGLVDIPEHRRRRAVDHASQRFPPRAWNEKLSERDVDHLIIGLFLDLGGELLLVVQRRGARELIAQLLDRGVLGPAEPAAILVLSTDREVPHRIRS